MSSTPKPSSYPPPSTALLHTSQGLEFRLDLMDYEKGSWREHSLTATKAAHGRKFRAPRCLGDGN